MKIKDEWRDAMTDRMHQAGFGPVSDKDADFILSAIAPLIAQDVIEACAAFVDGFTWCPSTVGALIRREVPKLLLWEGK